MSDDAELGAHIKNNAYQALVDIRDWLYTFGEARGEAVEKAQSEAKLRGQ